MIEAYGDGSGWVMANPVGTGPYRLKEWRRGQQIVLEAKPELSRRVAIPESSDPADRAIIAKLKRQEASARSAASRSASSRKSNPRLLAFEQGELDYVAVPADLVPNVLDPDNKLKPRFAKAGITLARGIQPAITYTYFNMEDPVVGGYTPEKIALRRAIGMAYNVDEEIRVLRAGPGGAGHAARAAERVRPRPEVRRPRQVRSRRREGAARQVRLHRPRQGRLARPARRQAARAARSRPRPAALDRQYDELWQRSMNAIGLAMEFVTQKWPDLLKVARLGQLQMWFLGNISTTTEGFGFLGLLYGGNAGFSNLARFKLPEFDRLYEQARAMPDGPERDEAPAADVASSSPPTRRGSSTRTATRTCSCIRGSSATSTTRSTSIRGRTTTSTASARKSASQ